MKTKAIAIKYGISQDEFDSFIIENKMPYSGGLIMGLSVEDSKVQDYVHAFQEEKKRKEQLAAKAKEEAEEKARLEAEEAERKRRCLSEMLISSGFSFDGYTITKYSGYISGDDATQIPRSGFFSGNNNGSNLTDALVKIRRQALMELKEAAYNLGCNAVVGVDFDYITLEPETANIGGGTTYEPYVICVTANGNAVVIEKK